MTTATPTARPTAPAKQRFVRVLRLATATQPGLLDLEQDGEHALYAVTPLHNDLGGESYRFAKLGTERVYHVLLGRAEESHCDCPGQVRWGHRRPCRHLAALAALRQANKCLVAADPRERGPMGCYGTHGD